MSLQTQDVVNACKRRPVLCVCILLGVALALVFYFRKDELALRETTLEDRSKFLRKLNSNTAYAAQLEQQIKALREINQTFALKAMREGELALNQQLFLRLESDTGVKLIDLRPQPVPPLAKGAKADAYIKMGFSLTISGEYRQLILFLKKLEQGSTLARVNSASTSEPNQGLQTMSLNVELLGLRR